MNQFNFEPQRKHLHSIQRIPIIGTDEKMADRNDRWHAYYTCAKCKNTYGSVNQSRGEWRRCENKGCGGEMNSPTNEVCTNSKNENKNTF